MRVRIAQEAARLMSEGGMQDFYAAKRKAAQHLGAPDTRNMPRNQEVEVALQEHQRLFLGEQQIDYLRALREAAVQAMRFLAGFNPRLVGSVLSGTASRHADINLHLFADTPEQVNLFLIDNNIPFEASMKRQRVGRESWEEYPAYQFMAGEYAVDLLVFPSECRREAPRSPVDGKPMQRARIEEIELLIRETESQ
ncbi:FIG00856772: hypothetical protein [hydrothermal vent metagenome]|uniref:Polymerase nucleotidyl transferase domain-containing protein n=1 Tax=hydrothermal vent metagenome TaxID=652676 RepID=A0A3B0YW27_9ZZZZ